MVEFVKRGSAGRRGPPRAAAARADKQMN